MSSYALLIGISHFIDPKLAKLNAPSSDVEALAEVLKDPERGGFSSVAISIDQDLQTIRDQIAALLDERAPDDFVLLYYSGHGILTKGQRLFLATGQTQFERPQPRSLSAHEIREMLDQSRASKQVVILDCCHSGAFVEGVKGPTQTVTSHTFGTDDIEGQYVLSATDSLQFAYDSSGTLKQSSGVAPLSRFTNWLVDAIGQGEAAPNSERITLDAVFDYLSRRARSEAVGMTPRRFVKRNSGDMVIARNPEARIASAWIAKLDSPDWKVRLDAVMQLGSQKEIPANRDLIEVALTNRISGERDVEVRAAMLALLRKLGEGTPVTGGSGRGFRVGTVSEELATAKPAPPSRVNATTSAAPQGRMKDDERPQQGDSWFAIFPPRIVAAMLIVVIGAGLVLLFSWLLKSAPRPAPEPKLPVATAKPVTPQVATTNLSNGRTPSIAPGGQRSALPLPSGDPAEERRRATILAFAKFAIGSWELDQQKGPTDLFADRMAPDKPSTMGSCIRTTKMHSDLEISGLDQSKENLLGQLTFTVREIFAFAPPASGDLDMKDTCEHDTDTTRFLGTFAATADKSDPPNIIGSIAITGCSEENKSADNCPSGMPNRAAPSATANKSGSGKIERVGDGLKIDNLMYHRK